jgi:hypothetical protein
MEQVPVEYVPALVGCSCKLTNCTCDMRYSSPGTCQNPIITATSGSSEGQLTKALWSLLECAKKGSNSIETEWLEGDVIANKISPTIRY